MMVGNMIRPGTVPSTLGRWALQMDSPHGPVAETLSQYDLV